MYEKKEADFPGPSFLRCLKSGPLPYIWRFWRCDLKNLITFSDNNVLGFGPEYGPVIHNNKVK